MVSVAARFTVAVVELAQPLPEPQFLRVAVGQGRLRGKLAEFRAVEVVAETQTLPMVATVVVAKFALEFTGDGDRDDKALCNY
jgi:hypothetical protein